MKSIFLSIIVPNYNESENIKRGVIDQIYSYLKDAPFSWEVIISDDGSTDQSRTLIKRAIPRMRGVGLLENQHGGKPSALWHGMQKAKGAYVLFTDMDQSTPITELHKLLPYISKYKAVIGSRGKSRKNFPLYRRLGSMIFSAVRKSLVLPKINDTQCGFKLFERKTVEEIFPKLEFLRKRTKVSGWSVTSWDVEFLYILEKKGFTLKEVLVEWRDEDTSKNKGGGLGRYLRESKEMLSEILTVRLNDIRGLYD